MRMERRTLSVSATSATPLAGTQLQSNRSDGGGRGADTSVGSPRWVRILRITMGSSLRSAHTPRAHPHSPTASVLRNSMAPAPAGVRAAGSRLAHSWAALALRTVS